MLRMAPGYQAMHQLIIDDILVMFDDQRAVAALRAAETPALR